MIPGYTPQVALAPHTTFKTGGPAEYFAEAESVAALQQLVAAAQTANQPVTLLGGGSNVLVADTGVAGCVIKNTITGWQEAAGSNADSVRITVGAGEVFDDIVAKTVVAGWWGLENLSHIPGSVGATPIQNVGAYGVEVADCVVAVHTLDSTTGATHEFAADQCGFGYRDSWFKTPAGRAHIVTHVTYQLSRTPQPQLAYRDLATWFADTSAPPVEMVREAVMAIRAKKFPDWHAVGTAGSFFTNPIIPRPQYEALLVTYPELPHYDVSPTYVKVPLGWILDQVCHLRGTYEGAVGCYAGQALVLVQTGGATTAEVTAFAESVVADVQAKTGIDINWEVTLIGA